MKTTPLFEFSLCKLLPGKEVKKLKRKTENLRFSVKLPQFQKTPQERILEGTLINQNFPNSFAELFWGFSDPFDGWPALNKKSII